jgi:hypothetical protein
MIAVTKKKMELSKGPRKLEDAAVLMMEENRRRIREAVAAEAAVPDLSPDK